MKESADQNWAVRVLSRQIHSLYYERTILSRDKAPLAAEMRESQLEQAILGKLQAFMLELGKGFAFVARQYRISTETKDFYIDLVFYNYNPTVGLILCSERDHTVVKYSVLNDDRQLFASRYRPYLPTEKQLREEIERETLAVEQEGISAVPAGPS